MRVALFVYAPSTVSFSHPATLTRYSTSGLRTLEVPAAPVALERGVYQVSSELPFAIRGAGAWEASLSLSAENPWPDPSATTNRFTTAFPELSLQQLYAVFPEMASSLAVAASAAPATAGGVSSGVPIAPLLAYGSGAHKAPVTLVRTERIVKLARPSAAAEQKAPLEEPDRIR